MRAHVESGGRCHTSYRLAFCFLTSGSHSCLQVTLVHGNLNPWNIKAEFVHDGLAGDASVRQGNNVGTASKRPQTSDQVQEMPEYSIHYKNFGDCHPGPLARDLASLFFGNVGAAVFADKQVFLLLEEYHIMLVGLHPSLAREYPLQMFLHDFNVACILRWVEHVAAVFETHSTGYVHRTHCCCRAAQFVSLSLTLLDDVA